jgi:hypothetical protein
MQAKYPRSWLLALCGQTHRGTGEILGKQWGASARLPDRSNWIFHAWKGVVLSKQEYLDKSQDSQKAIVKPDFPRQVIGLIEINIPLT